HQHKREYTQRYINAVKRGSLIIPMIKEMMYEHDISPLFLYVSMVESAFKTDAKSSTGAGGLWQFTVNTGSKEFNLHVGRTLDERYDPIRSTYSAIKYLYKMNNDLDAWYLTTMAYNCGNGCVNRSIRKARTKDLGTLISSRHNYIKPETRKYIQKVLLMAMIGENYLFNPRDNLGEMMYRINRDSITPVKVRSGESLANLSKILNMDAYYLKKINAHLKNGRVPHRDGYHVNIPKSKLNMFNQRYAQSLHPKQPRYVMYRHK
ncbi:MAG TPA: lytic transglycosylase, partial [Campylobacterales bacterium]|nr:lytic transglycosylase [Campylobacterales bacterium]